MPRVSNKSLCATGRPCNGPKVSLCVCISSAFAAASAAISGTRVTMAFTFGFTRSICFRCASSTSRADSFFVCMRWAISTALIKQIEVVVDCASRVLSKRSIPAIPKRTSRRVGSFSLIVVSLCALVGPRILRFVRLTETITGIGHSEAAVLHCRHLEIVRGAVVLRCWRSLLALCWSLDRGHWHGCQRFVEHVRDEHARLGIFLAAQQREVHLPDIDQTRRAKKHLHRFGLSAFAGSVVHDRGPWMKRIYEQLRIQVSMTSKKIQIHRAKTIVGTHQVELPVQRQVP